MGGLLIDTKAAVAPSRLRKPEFRVIVLSVIRIVMVGFFVVVVAVVFVAEDDVHHGRNRQLSWSDV
jgi:hypothetical protein